MLYAAAVALFLTIVMVLLLKPVASSVGLLDTPSDRKNHQGAIPLIGGVAIYAALGLSALIFPFWTAHHGVTLIMLCLPILIIGVSDDRSDLSVRGRLLVEICCCLAAALFFDIRLETLGRLIPGVELSLGFLAVPVTVFGMVGVMNAFNMVDGVDGLSGCLAVMTVNALALLAVDADISLQLLTLAAALVGFLFFNSRLLGRSRAAIFMGDAGTMVIGFILAWYMILMSQGQSAPITPVSALWLFAVPLMDTVAIMIRRIRRGRSPFEADCEHLHHILLMRGVHVNLTVLSIVGLQAACIAYAVFSLRLEIPQWISFALFLGVFAVYSRIVTLACRLK
jgi:UDP-GlcNAc:undecaprenyl-phosphate GlcNAc-1-phosphate transferase